MLYMSLYVTIYGSFAHERSSFWEQHFKFIPNEIRWTGSISFQAWICSSNLESQGLSLPAFPAPTWQRTKLHTMEICKTKTAPLHWRHHHVPSKPRCLWPWQHCLPGAVFRNMWFWGYLLFSGLSPFSLLSSCGVKVCAAWFCTLASKTHTIRSGLTMLGCELPDRKNLFPIYLCQCHHIWCICIYMIWYIMILSYLL